MNTPRVLSPFRGGGGGGGVVCVCVGGELCTSMTQIAMLAGVLYSW